MRIFNAVGICAVVVFLLASTAVAPAFAMAAPTAADDSTIVLQTDAPEANETDAEDESEDEEETESAGGDAAGGGSVEIDVDSGNASADNESADSDGAGVDAGAGGGGGMSAAYGGGGGDDSSFVEDRLDDIKEWFMSTAASGAVEAYETLMEELNQLLYTLPAPGEPTDPMSWYTPDNGWWPDVMGLYWMFGSVSVGVLILAGGASFIGDDPRMSRGYLRLSVLGIFAIISGPLFIGAYLHFMNLLSLAVAPSGQEFLEGPENMVQLAAGSGLFFVLLKIKVGLLIVGLIVLFGQFIFTFASVATWPFSWAARAVPIAGINSFGVLLFNVFIYLPLLKLVQAAIMRFMFGLSWGAYSWIGGVLILIGTIIVVGVVFIFLPWKSAEKLLHAAGVHLGMSAVREKSQNAKDVSIEKASNVKQKWADSPRGQTSSDSSAQPNTSSRSRGGTNTSSGPSSMPKAASSFLERQSNVRRRRRDINRSTRSDD